MDIRDFPRVTVPFALLICQWRTLFDIWRCRARGIFEFRGARGLLLGFVRGFRQKFV